MYGIEPRTENFVDALQMMQVRAAQVASVVAGAGRVERSRVGAMAGVADLDVPVACEQPAVARIAGGQHAVEYVDTVADSLDDVLRRADAHEVTRAIGREPRRDMRLDAPHLLLRLADRQAADRIAVEADAA